MEKRLASPKGLPRTSTQPIFDLSASDEEKCFLILTLGVNLVNLHSFFARTKYFQVKQRTYPRLEHLNGAPLG
jgi:hypothetical protein